MSDCRCFLGLGKTSLFTLWIIYCLLPLDFEAHCGGSRETHVLFADIWAVWDVSSPFSLFGCNIGSSSYENFFFVRVLDWCRFLWLAVMFSCLHYDRRSEIVTGSFHYSCFLMVISDTLWQLILRGWVNMPSATGNIPSFDKDESITSSRR